MNKLSVPSLLEAQADIQTAKASQSVILVSAWLGTLLLSRLPQIVLSELGVMNPSDWSLWWWIMMGIALFAITYIWAVLKPFSDERTASTKARCAGRFAAVFDARWTFVPATEHRFLNISVFCNKRFHLQPSQKHPVIVPSGRSEAISQEIPWKTYVRDCFVGKNALLATPALAPGASVTKKHFLDKL